MNRIITLEIWLRVLQTGTSFGVNEESLNNVSLTGNLRRYLH
jgi:hypothetical protein